MDSFDTLSRIQSAKTSGYLLFSLAVSTVLRTEESTRVRESDELLKLFTLCCCMRESRPALSCSYSEAALSTVCFNSNILRSMRLHSAGRFP